jgi:chromosome partitioning protein
MRRIAVINQKGGVGKTTTCVNLGAALAEAGRRVCLVDMDPQANLSLHLGLEIDGGEPSIYSVLLGQASFAEAVRPTATSGLLVVPSNIDLSAAELELASAIGRESLVRDAVCAWEDERRAEGAGELADYLIFDCPPSLGLLSVNALAAAHEVLITVQTEYLALMGMSKLLEVVQLIRRRLNPDLSVTGIVACLYDGRLRLAREVLGEVRRHFPGQVFARSVRSNVKLAEAPSHGLTIFEYAKGSNGARDYRALAAELIAQEAGEPQAAAGREAAEPLAEKVLDPVPPPGSPSLRASGKENALDVELRALTGGRPAGGGAAPQA